METVDVDGLEIIIAKMSLAEDQRWASAMQPGIWCGILAEGTIATSRAGFDHTWGPRTAINYSVEVPVTVEHLVPEACQMSAVFIRLPFERVDALAGPGARSALAPKNNYRAWQNHRTASALAWQMLGCHLVGPARRLYLSGKALEMLSVVAQTDALGANGAAGTERVASARAGEIERVHAARAQLLSSLSAPPSVPELARAVGMNAHRLGELFRIVFGTSIYAFVKASRLEHAKTLLERRIAAAIIRRTFRPSFANASGFLRASSSRAMRAKLRQRDVDPTVIREIAKTKTEIPKPFRLLSAGCCRPIRPREFVFWGL